MNILAPGLLLFGLLAVPIILLYMLKLRRQDKVVSSTYLWQQILRDQQANAPFQRLRVQLLLFIQLLILTALVLGLVRPVNPKQALVSGPTIFILDGSASMSSKDVEPNRFTQAKKEIQTIIDQLPDQTPATIILAAGQPRILISNESDRQKLSQATAAAELDLTETDWKSAFSLVINLAGKPDQNGEIQTNIFVVSDGGFNQNDLPDIPGHLRFVTIGKDKENLGVTALAVRLAADGLQLFSNVHNYGETKRQFVFTALADDQTIDNRQIELAPGTSQDILLSGLPAGGCQFTVKLNALQGETGSVEPFSLDDSAHTIYQPVSGGRALIMTKGNVFLQQLFKNMSGVMPYTNLVEGDTPVTLPAGSYDFYIFDGVAPQTIPPGNILWINPPDNELFQTQGSFSPTNVVQIADSQITKYVDWRNIHISKAKRISLPSWATLVIQNDGNPLVFAGEVDGRKVAVLSFDLHDSDLPMQITFPVLFSNLLQFLSTQNNLSMLTDTYLSANKTKTDEVQETNLEIDPGGRIQISPQVDLEKILVTLPDGTVSEVKPKDGKAVFSQTGKTGLYWISYPGHTEIKNQGFAVNLFNPQESSITTKDWSVNGKQAATQKMETVTINQEYWPWLVGVGLLLICFEWLVYRYFQSHSTNKWPKEAPQKNI